MGTTESQTFECYSCSRRYRWRDDLPGRTIRCSCGVKFRCPDRSDHLVAEESLDDTVADVELNDAFDDLSNPHGDPEKYDEVGPLRVQTRGLLGLGPAGETLFWGIGLLIGVAFGLLAIIVADWFYIACALLLVISAVKFAKAWKRWTRGRPWMECLMESLGERESA